VELNETVKWSIDDMLQISLAEPDDFLKVKETLTRIGVASQKDNTLFQSCHILQKRGLYYIVHFKELFLLDGKISSLEIGDLARRNTIAQLLSDWNLIEIISKPEKFECAPMREIKIISYKEKNVWNLVPKYNIGKK